MASIERIFEASGASFLGTGRERKGRQEEDGRTGIMMVELWTDGQLFLVLTVLMLMFPPLVIR